MAETNLLDLLLGVLACDSAREDALSRISDAIGSDPQYLLNWSEKISVETFVHLILVIVDDGEGFDTFYGIMSTIIDCSEFKLISDETALNSDSMADLVDKVGNVADKPYALLYTMTLRIAARQEMSTAFFSHEHRLDHVGVLMALSQSCTTETEEHALSAIFNFGVISNALSSIVERDGAYVVRLAKIVIEGTHIGKNLALTMLAQLVYKHMDRKKALSAKPLKLLPYLIVLLRNQKDPDLRNKAIKLLSGIAEVPENKTEFVSVTSPFYLLPDLFNILDEEYSETRTFAILILWALAKEHKSNQDLLLSPQFRLIPRLLHILESNSECRGKALGLLGVIFENARLAESLISEEALASRILAIAVQDPEDKTRTNALIIVTKMAENAAWKSYLVSQGNVLLDQFLETALSPLFPTARWFAIRALYCLANEFPIVATYCFKWAGRFLDLLRDDASANKFRILQFLSSVMSNEENQRLVQYEAQKNMDTSLFQRLLVTILPILTDIPSSSTTAAQPPMTKSVAIDVLRALSDKNSTMQSLLFHSDLKLMDALGQILDAPEPINGNYDPKAVVLKLLFNMSGNDDLKSAFVNPKYNLTGRLLRVILAPPTRENSRAKQYAAGTICRLVSMHTDNQILFANRSLGALPILVDCIRNHDTTWKTKEFAVGALVHIARLPANHWVAYDPDLALFPTTFDLLRQTKQTSTTEAKTSHNDEVSFYLLGVVEDLLEAYDRPDATPLDTTQREALLSELYGMGTVPYISATKAKALRILLMLSVDTGHVLTIRGQRLDLVQILVSFLSQVCDPLSSMATTQAMGEKDRGEYLRCINQFTSNKRAKSITSFLIRDGLHLLSTLYRFLTLPTTTATEEKLVSSILWNLAENGDQAVSAEFVRHNIHVIALDTLQDTLRQRSLMDDFRTQLLNMLMNMARHFSVRDALKAAGAVEVAEKLLYYRHREGSFYGSAFAAVAADPSAATSSPTVIDEAAATAGASNGSTSTRDRSNTDDLLPSVTDSNASGSAAGSRNNNPTNSLKALLILLFLFGNEETSSSSSSSPTAAAVASSTVAAAASGSVVPPSSMASSSLPRRAQEVVTMDRLKTLLEIFALTLQCRGGKDFYLGTFCLPLIVDACVVISQSDSNKAALISLGVTPLLTKVLTMYVNNQSAIPFCGGGGKDEETAVLAIEALMHLSFSFGTHQNRELQEAFLRNNTQLLEILPAVQEKPNLSLESKNKAVILQYRLTSREGSRHTPRGGGSAGGFSARAFALPASPHDTFQELHAPMATSRSVAAPVMTSTTVTTSQTRRGFDDDLAAISVDAQSDEAGRHSSGSLHDAMGPQTVTTSTGAVSPKHVMLSYCWDPSANPMHVKKLAQELRHLGYDVWRDEDGSSLLPAVSGAVDDRLAEAIEKSDTVVVCVSAAYKRSSSCRLEAMYAQALAGRQKVKLMFVMMNDYYTTKSHPHHCDGWLGFMIGDSYWYPMWQENRIGVVAAEMAKSFGDDAKLATRKIPKATTPLPSSGPTSSMRRQSFTSSNGSSYNVFETASSTAASASTAATSSSTPATAAASSTTPTPAALSATGSVYTMQQENPLFHQSQALRRSSSGGPGMSIGQGIAVGMMRKVTSTDDAEEDGEEDSISAFTMEDIYTSQSAEQLQLTSQGTPDDHPNGTSPSTAGNGAAGAGAASASASASSRTSISLPPLSPHVGALSPAPTASSSSTVAGPFGGTRNGTGKTRRESTGGLVSNPLAATRRHSHHTTGGGGGGNGGGSHAVTSPGGGLLASRSDDHVAPHLLFTPTHASNGEPFHADAMGVNPMMNTTAAAAANRARRPPSPSMSSYHSQQQQSTHQQQQTSVLSLTSTSFPPPPPAPVHPSSLLQHQISSSSISNHTAPEDTMTEITSEEDALVIAWRLLHTPELVKDHGGLEEYLLEEGIKTVELLGYCDPEDWLHIASFLRNKPRKRFVEIMHQWYLAKSGFAAHQLLATPPVLSTASSVAMPPPPVVYGVHGGAAMEGNSAMHETMGPRSAASALFGSVSAAGPSESGAAAGADGNGGATSGSNDDADDDVQAYRIGLPVTSTTTTGLPTVAATLSSSSASTAQDDSATANAATPSKVIVDDVPELPNNPNVFCAMPEFCVIS